MTIHDFTLVDHVGVLTKARERSLAAVITRLINEAEPLLHAERERHTTILVRERGGPGLMRVTISDADTPEEGGVER